MFDFIIINGLVIDVFSGQIKKQNVGISQGKIRYLGDKTLIAKKTINAEGLYVSPGFIDVHGHSEFNLLIDPRAEGKLSQGITTEINGNCGFSAAPLKGVALKRRLKELQELGIKERWSSFKEYQHILTNQGISINYATLCGHGNIRASILGYEDKPLSKDNLVLMKKLFLQALKEGALGLSSGLIYPPGIFSKPSEIIELLKSVPDNRQSIIYTSHIRDEGDKLLEAVEEIIYIGKETNKKIHISHIKTSGENNWWKIDKVIDLIENAQSRGIKITCDTYPYIASNTDLDTLLPSWVYEGGIEAELERLKKPTIVKQITEELLKKDDTYWKNVLISSVKTQKNKWMEGKSIFDISKRIKKTPAITVIEIIISEETSAGAIFFTMNEQNLERFLKLPYLMIGSDSSARSFSGPTYKSKPHPRGFGTFPRYIGRYVRDKHLIQLPEAIKKITLLPANTFGLKKRGAIKESFFADIVIFDYNQIIDTASFEEPFSKSKGIEYVFVNGELAIEKKEFTNKLNGKII
ncbi:MAG: D-aminoacylase [Thermodesulfovibrionales bacterium]|nr:D-aminoacylase [Thermodesulfovibrionales bacterium]